jgi:hypothetical protein
MTAQPERKDANGNERKSKSRRFLYAVASFVIAVLLVTAVIVWYTLTAHTPEYCGPWVDGAPMYFTEIDIGGLSDNLTASWKAKCVTERFGEVSHIRMRMYADFSPLLPDYQSLRFNTPFSFGLTVKAIVHDEDSDGRLSTGDSFFVYGMSGSHDWRFELVDDSTIMQIAAWDTP